MLEGRRRNPKVTAIFANSACAALAAKTFKVPEEISVVSFLDRAPQSPPPMTAVAVREPAEAIALWACSEIISRIQVLEQGRPMPPPRQVLFVPELILRQSTRALARRAKEKAGGPAIGPIGPMGRIGGMGSTAASPWDSWSKTYAYLKRSRSRNWRQFDLSKLANHSMTREHGWLGADPLLHFPPGLRSIHGVPFHVIEETLNGGRAVVTFRSPHTHSTEGKELPASAKLLLGGRVKALYFLHGCGWADKPVRFAEYQVHFQSGKAASIPLVPFGPSPSIALKLHGRLKPNLQDWYSLLEHPDFPHAKSVTVVNPADPEAYDRYLYTLEWINPQPKEEVTHIEVRVDPEAGPTLALIAVTALA